MTFAARVHQPAGGSSFLPLGTMSLFGESFDDVGFTDSATVTFNVDGTISRAVVSSSPAITMPTNWYGPTTGGIGNSFQIRFTLQSGTPWDSGLTSGVLYPLSSARSLGWTVPYSPDGNAYAVVLVEIFYSAGTTPYKSGTLTVSLYNGEA